MQQRPLAARFLAKAGDGKCGVFALPPPEWERIRSRYGDSVFLLAGLFRLAAHVLGLQISGSGGGYSHSP
jgi:hypothetical protein